MKRVALTALLFAVARETREHAPRGRDPARIVSFGMRRNRIWEAAMQTPPMAEAMEHDGVLPETLVILTEA